MFWNAHSFWKLKFNRFRLSSYFRLKGNYFLCHTCNNVYDEWYLSHIRFSNLSFVFIYFESYLIYYWIYGSEAFHLLYITPRELLEWIGTRNHIYGCLARSWRKHNQIWKAMFLYFLAVISFIAHTLKHGRSAYISVYFLFWSTI